MPSDRTVLVTGAAGFIGFHTARRLLERGTPVVGLDNLNAYYDVGLKRDRLARLSPHHGFTFIEAGIEDRAAVEDAFARHAPRVVINLAAQPGVRYSVDQPHAYVESNVVGFMNVLDACRSHDVEHLVYASSSSVYGSNTKLPFSTADPVDHPVSIYAATKKANELMAHAYGHLHCLPTTGLRFFTVYGPWGRPDMAFFIFTKALFEGRTIPLFDGGRMRRDFTYVDDIVEGILRVADRAPSPKNDDGASPRGASPYYRLYNIGNHTPVIVSELIAMLARLTERTACVSELPLQPGEVPATFADVDDLTRDIGFQPNTPLEVGAARFVEWYREYYKPV